MRLQLAVMVFMMTNAVLFGLGIVAVLSIPESNGDAGPWIATVVIASVAVAAPFSWLIAPRLRLRYWKNKEAEHQHAAGQQHG